MPKTLKEWKEKIGNYNEKEIPPTSDHLWDSSARMRKRPHFSPLQGLSFAENRPYSCLIRLTSPHTTYPHF